LGQRSAPSSEHDISTHLIAEPESTCTIATLRKAKGAAA
jgi:hypothetical protein